MFESTDKHPDGAQIRSSTEELVKVFTITTRKELEKHCRTLVIEKEAFAGLVLGCATGEIPWLHRASRKYVVPEHLELNGRDIESLAEARVGQSIPKGAQKAFNKMEQTFKDRTVQVGHIFAAPNLSWWNLFYFSEKDTSMEDSHWVGGAHIHLINDLTRPRETAHSIWSKFEAGSNLGSAIHIRFSNSKRENTSCPVRF